MRLTIPKDLETFIREKVQTGRYRNTNEAINDALRLLKERDEAQFRALRSLLKQRIKESKRGDSVLFDYELREQIRRRGMQRLRAGKKSRS
jgi:putative addiction module CopG family antidote